jgi:hypothetical protein
MLVRLGFEKSKPITFEMEFVVQNSDQVGLKLLSDEDKKAMQLHLEKLNKIIGDDATLQKEFDNYVLTWKPIMNTWIQPYRGIMASFYKRGLLPSIITKNKKLLYTNLMRCEAHRDILINSINPNE